MSANSWEFPESQSSSAKNEDELHRYLKGGRMTELFSTGEVSKLLAIKPYQLTYVLNLGIVPEPKRLSGRRLFTKTDIERLRQHFSSKDEE